MKDRDAFLSLDPSTPHVLLRILLSYSLPGMLVIPSSGTNDANSGWELTPPHTTALQTNGGATVPIWSDQILSDQRPLQVTAFQIGKNHTSNCFQKLGWNHLFNPPTSIVPMRDSEEVWCGTWHNSKCPKRITPNFCLFTLSQPWEEKVRSHWCSAMNWFHQYHY